MTTAYDVPPEALIRKISEKLKEENAITSPEWAAFVKTGIHKEKAPVDPDWWYTRVAAVLRKVYMKGPIGSERLSAEFGGKRDKGSKRYKAARGSGSIARKSLAQLESAGLVEKNKNRGRMVTSRGRSMLDNIAHEVKKEVMVDNPAMAKY